MTVVTHFVVLSCVMSAVLSQRLDYCYRSFNWTTNTKNAQTQSCAVGRETLLQMRFLPTPVCPEFTAHFFTDRPKIGELTQDNFTFNENFTETNLTVEGNFLGYSYVQFSNNSAHAPSLPLLILAIYRMPNIGDYVFVLVTIFGLFLAQIYVGMRSPPRAMREMKGKWKPILVGLGLQFTMMPLLSFGLSKMLDNKSAPIALGFFVAGCVPGGGISNMHSYLLGGDYHLSVAMTVLSITLGIGLLPMWIAILADEVIDYDDPIIVPYANMAFTVALTWVSMVIGMTIIHFAPKVAEASMKWFFRPFLLLMVIYYVTWAIYTNSFMFYYFTWQLIFACIILPYGGMLIGYLVGKLCRFPREQIVCIAMEVGIQNTSVALALVQATFPIPSSNLATVAPYAIMIIANVPVIFADIAWIYYVKKYLPSKDRAMRKEKEDFAEKSGVYEQSMASNLDKSLSSSSAGTGAATSSQRLQSSEETAQFFEHNKSYTGLSD